MFQLSSENRPNNNTLTVCLRTVINNTFCQANLWAHWWFSVKPLAVLYAFERSIFVQYFMELLSVFILLQVPSINSCALHQVAADSLVRYRCMVQDMFDPELYLARFKVTSRKTGQAVMRSGRYRDIATCAVSSAFTVAVIDSSCPILATMDTEIMSPLLKSKRSKLHSLRSTMGIYEQFY